MENKLVEPEALHRNEVTNETEKIGKYYKWLNKKEKREIPQSQVKKAKPKASPAKQVDKKQAYLDLKNKKDKDKKSGDSKSKKEIHSSMLK